MKNVILSVLVLALVLSCTAIAANFWSGEVKIQSLEISNVNAEGVWIRFTSDPYASHTCSNKNGQYMLGGGATNIDKMTVLAISALEGSRSVTAYWGGACNGGGTTGYPVLLGLTLR